VDRPGGKKEGRCLQAMEIAGVTEARSPDLMISQSANAEVDVSLREFQLAYLYTSRL
jgi:hypothetical protein